MPYIGRSEKFGVRNRFYYTQASGGATSISGNDDAGKGLSFTDGAYVDVALNGVTLVAGTDYNTTTANTIAGLSALSAGDIIEILVYDVFNVADTVSASSGGTFSGGVTVAGTMTATSFTGDGSALTGTFSPSYALLEDRQTKNTAGGTTVNPSAFAQRQLNTEVADPDGIVTLSGHAFTLGAGTYRIDWGCPAYNCGANKSRLFDSTNTAYYDGESAFANNSGNGGNSYSRGSAIVTLTSNATFQIQHRCNDAGIGSGYGRATNFGQHEVYTRVQIVKIAAQGQKMAWVLIENNVVIRSQSSSEDGLVEVSDDICCGQVRQSDGSFINPTQSDDDKLEALRDARNLLLTVTDWWAVQDRTMSQAEKDYRQALRDITDSATSLDDVTWPTKPE